MLSTHMSPFLAYRDCKTWYLKCIANAHSQPGPLVCYPQRSRISKVSSLADSALAACCDTRAPLCCIRSMLQC